MNQSIHIWSIEVPRVLSGILVPDEDDATVAPSAPCCRFSGTHDEARERFKLWRATNPGINLRLVDITTTMQETMRGFAAKGGAR